MSYRALAVAERSQEQFYRDRDQGIFLAVILELAHALSRGRRPSVSCLLPGINLRKWLQKVYIDVPPDSLFGYRDYEGEPCSLAGSVIDDFFGWSLDHNNTSKYIRAVNLVRKELVYPRKREKEFRGDYAYQSANPNTNLKRKKRYWERRQEYLPPVYFNDGSGNFYKPSTLLAGSFFKW